MSFDIDKEIYKAIEDRDVERVDVLRRKFGMTGLESYYYNGTFCVFDLAVDKGHPQIVDLFLQADANRIIAAKKPAALVYALKKDFISVAKKLLDAGFDPDWTSDAGISARWVARAKGLDDMLQGMEEKFPFAKPVSENGWHKIDDLTVAHVAQEKNVGYKLTDIFNFRSRERISLTQNLQTNVETRETRSFDEINDKAQLEEAIVELNKRGGNVEADAVYARLIRKSPLPKKDYPRVS